MQLQKGDLVSVEVDVPVIDPNGKITNYQTIPADYEVTDFSSGAFGKKIKLERRSPHEMVDNSIPYEIEQIKAPNGNITSDVGTFAGNIKMDVHTKITSNITDPSRS